MNQDYLKGSQPNHKQWHIPWQTELGDSLVALNNAIHAGDEDQPKLLRQSIDSILYYLGSNSCCLEEVFSEHESRLRSASITNDTRAILSSLEEFFGRPQNRLATYGTLQPGESNYHIVSGIEGSWLKGKIRGSVHQFEGYPRFIWEADGEEVDSSVLISEFLPEHMHRIDQFEGENYSRILVPVTIDDCTLVCNVYAKRLN